jgi:hypothetical protein
MRLNIECIKLRRFRNHLYCQQVASRWGDPWAIGKALPLTSSEVPSDRTGLLPSRPLIWNVAISSGLLPRVKKCKSSKVVRESPYSRLYAASFFDRS